MSIHYYLDSSALFKWYLEEPGSDCVVDAVSSAEIVAVSQLTLVEVTSAATRLVRGGDIDEALYRDLLESIDQDFQSRFQMIDLTRSRLRRAADLVQEHALRAADAVQLACALTAGLSDLVFMSADRELNAAARKSKLSIINPEED